ncbi:MAG: energy transducer TonB [Mucilaginibacter sp.]|jgi:TonB family protein|uniref:energy transducer TonB n=1 Tax=Mucilaginibacter sp. TaxID=1882438 RepID=UPI0035697A10
MIRKTLFVLFILLAPLSQTRAQTGTTDTTIYSKVDKAPKFAGGDKELIRFLNRNTRYPWHARNNNIQGTVQVSFVVETDGTLTNFKIIKSVAPDLDAESIRVMHSSPKWKPGKKTGKPVRTLHQVPISFTLIPG